MDRERKRWLEEESRNKMQEEENMRSNEERWGRERKAAQQLFHAEIETLKQQHAEHLNLLRQKWEEDKKEELAATTFFGSQVQRKGTILSGHTAERERRRCAQFFSALVRGSQATTCKTRLITFRLIRVWFDLNSLLKCAL